MKLKQESLLESLDKLTAENESLIKRTKSFEEEKHFFLETINLKQVIKININIFKSKIRFKLTRKKLTVLN